MKTELTMAQPIHQQQHPPSSRNRTLCRILVAISILALLHYSGTQNFFNEITLGEDNHSPLGGGDSSGSSFRDVDPLLKSCRFLRTRHGIGTCEVPCSRISPVLSRLSKTVASRSSSSSPSSSSRRVKKNTRSNRTTNHGNDEDEEDESGSADDLVNLDFIDANFESELSRPVEFEDYPCFEGCRCPAPHCALEVLAADTVAAMAATQKKFALHRARSTRRLRDGRVIACVDNKHFRTSLSANKEDELVCVGSEVGDQVPPPSQKKETASSSSSSSGSKEIARRELSRFKRATSWAFRRWFNWGESIAYGGVRRNGGGGAVEKENARINQDLLKKQEEEEDEEEKRLIALLKQQPAAGKNTRKSAAAAAAAAAAATEGGEEHHADELYRQLRRRRSERERQRRVAANTQLPKLVRPDNGGRISGGHSPSDGIFRLNNVCFRSEGAMGIAGFQSDASSSDQPLVEEFRGAAEFEPLASSSLRTREFQSYLSSPETAERLAHPPEFVLEMNVLLQPVEYLSESPQHFLYRAIAARNMARSLWGAGAKFHVIYVLLPSSYLDFSVEEELEQQERRKRELLKRQQQAQREEEEEGDRGEKNKQEGSDNRGGDEGEDTAAEAAAAAGALKMMKRIHERQSKSNVKLGGGGKSGEVSFAGGDPPLMKKERKQQGAKSSTSPTEEEQQQQQQQQQFMDLDDDELIIAALEGPKRFYQLIGQSWSSIIVPKSRSGNPHHQRYLHIPLRLRQALYTKELPFSAEELHRELLLLQRTNNGSSSSSSRENIPLACFKEVVVSHVCLGKCLARHKVGNQFHSPPMFLPRTTVDNMNLKIFRREIQTCIHKAPRSVANAFMPSVTIVVSSRELASDSIVAAAAAAAADDDGLSSVHKQKQQNPVDFGVAAIVPALRQQLEEMGLREGRFSRLNIITPHSLSPKEIFSTLIGTDVLIGTSLVNNVLALGWLLPQNGILVELVSPQRLLPMMAAEAAAAAEARRRGKKRNNKNLLKTTTASSKPPPPPPPPLRVSSTRVQLSWRDAICRYTRSGWNRYSAKCDIGANANSVGLHHLVLMLPSSSVSNAATVKQAMEKRWKQLRWQEKLNVVGVIIDDAAAPGRGRSKKENNSEAELLERRKREIEARLKRNNESMKELLLRENKNKEPVSSSSLSSSSVVVNQHHFQLPPLHFVHGGGNNRNLPVAAAAFPQQQTPQSAKRNHQRRLRLIETDKRLADAAATAKEENFMSQHLSAMIPRTGIYLGTELNKQLIKVALCRLIVYARDPTRIINRRGAGGKMEVIVTSRSRDPTSVMCRRIQNRRIPWNFTTWRYGFDD